MNLLSSLRCFFFSFWERIISTEHDDVARIDAHIALAGRPHVLPRFSQWKYITLFFSRRERVWLYMALMLCIASFGWFAMQFVAAHTTALPTSGGIYREGMIGTPNFINPLFSSESVIDQDISTLVFSGLMKWGPDQLAVPDLATTISENQQNATVTITLPKDARFHDNTPLTADDVVFTYERAQNAETQSNWREALSHTKITKVDTHTVLITFTNNNQINFMPLTLGILPRHIWNDVNPKDMRDSKYNKEAIGSGPYVIMHTARTGHAIKALRMKRHEYFYPKPANISELELRFTNTPQELFELFIRQEIDGVAGITTHEFTQLEKKRVNLHTFTLPEFTGLFFNEFAQTPLADTRVRSALARAVHKERVIEVATKGNATVVHTPLFDSYIDALTLPSFDTVAAAQMLEESGWKKVSIEEFITAMVEKKRNEALTAYKKEHAGAQPPLNWLETTATEIRAETLKNSDPLQSYARKKQNEFLSFSITTSRHEDVRAAAHFIANAWRQLGIHIQVIELEPEIIRTITLPGRNYEILLVGVVIDSMNDPFALWYKADTTASPAFARFSDAEFNELITKIAATKTQEERNAYMKKFTRAFLNANHAIILYTPTFSYAITPKIHGIHGYLLMRPADRFATIADWYLRTSWQWQW